MSAPVTFEHFEQEVKRLVEIFTKNLGPYKSPGYDEASLRQEFLNPFFRALGWDVENQAGNIPSHREVEIESRTEIGGRQKRADYLFRTDTRNRFVCEAKKPAETLDDKYAFQAKRYAWNKDLPLAVLTDFEEIKIYIVGGRPNRADVDVGLWKTWHFLQFPLLAREIWDLLSRDLVATGSIDRLLESLPKKSPGKGRAKQLYLIKPDRTRALDADFLNFLDTSRHGLASDLYKHNDHTGLLEDNRLNEATQRILDRLLFLRICEDRDIDTGVRLQSILETWQRNYDKETGKRPKQTYLLSEEPPKEYSAGINAPKDSLWHHVVRHFRALDRRPPTHVPFFNGNLFKPHFSEELLISDEWLADFIRELSDEESPYLFSVIPVEILGTIYERFLGKVVRPHGRGVTIEEKPEVRKAGGVYYTPRYIVDYIVEQTVGVLVADKTPEQSLKLTILDPACGSGSFLIRAFERMCEHWQRWLMQNPDKRKKKWCWVETATGDVHLTVDLKRQILTQNIYGVDLDSAAVEVSQLSLYLKMLEGENRTTLKAEKELFGEEIALLPPLEKNIKCFNSLISCDYSMMSDELLRVNAGDWPVKFPLITKNGGFDAVVGNPPYIRIQGFPEEQVSYFVKNYSAATGNYDIYVNFVERGRSLLSGSGRLGMILPNKFFRTDYGIGLRSVLSKKGSVSEIVDFGAEQVFDATTYTCLLILSQKPVGTFRFATSKADEKFLKELQFETRATSSLSKEAWTLVSESQSLLIAKLKSVGTRLLDLPADMSRGSSSGDDEVFIVESSGHGLESEVLRTPLFASDFGRYHFEPEGKWLIIFPYTKDGEGFRLITNEEFKQNFPKAFEYLQQNIGRLKERKQFKEWFSYSAPRNLELHDRAQIAVPLLADKGLCALIPKHSRGTICPMASGGFTITLGATCKLKPEFVLGVLNSKLAFWFLQQISNIFRGGWITCTKQYFGEIPIISLNLGDAAIKAKYDRLVALVEKMLGLPHNLSSARSESDRTILGDAITATDQQIDQLVYELYGLTPEEIALVEGTA